jgi:hypothetical protein
MEYCYIALYGGKRVEVNANTLFEAKTKACALLRVPPKRSHMVSVVLAKRPYGSNVVHSTAGL